jgi:hypothetical protein
MLGTACPNVSILLSDPTMNRGAGGPWTVEKHEFRAPFKPLGAGLGGMFTSD